jgi:hypothetical protein
MSTIALIMPSNGYSALCSLHQDTVPIIMPGVSVLHAMPKMARWRIVQSVLCAGQLRSIEEAGGAQQCPQPEP